MGSWDAFDSYQNPLSSQFPGGPPPSHAWHTSHRDVQPRLIATTPQSGLSLDRYLQLLHLLTGGPNPATGTWVVRPLGELERAAVKLEDLKNVLAINGLVAGSKNKQDMLDKMRGIALVAPVCHIPLATTPSPPGPSLPEKNTQSGQNELLEGMRRAMEWANLSPAIKTAAANAIKQQGFYSYCPLPAIPKPARAPQNTSWEHNVDMHALVGSAPRPVPCASTTTIASRPAIHLHHVAESPTPDAIMHEAEQEEANSKHETPEWLLSSLETLMETCQGSQEIITERALIGRKARVALVLTEDFEQDGNGAVDTVERGVHLGQVVEWIGAEHDVDACATDCTQLHCYCYVRVAPSRTTAPWHSAGRRRLDLAVDLREEFRFEALEDLMNVDGDRLADAWVLCEPRE